MIIQDICMIELEQACCTSGKPWKYTMSRYLFQRCTVSYKQKYMLYTCQKKNINTVCIFILFHFVYVPWQSKNISQYITENMYQIWIYIFGPPQKKHWAGTVPPETTNSQPYHRRFWPASSDTSSKNAEKRRKHASTRWAPTWMSWEVGKWLANGL